MAAAALYNSIVQYFVGAEYYTRAVVQQATQHSKHDDDNKKLQQKQKDSNTADCFLLFSSFALQEHLL